MGAVTSWVLRLRPAGPARGGIQQCDVCAGCKPELTLGHYHVAWLDSDADDCLLGSGWRSVGAQYGDRCDGSGAGLDQPDVFAVLAFLNRGFRDHRSARFHAEAQADTDELARPERVVGVGKGGLEPDRCRWWVHGVVDEGEMPLRAGLPSVLAFTMSGPVALRRRTSVRLCSGIPKVT